MNPYSLALLALISLSGLSHDLLANPLITEVVSANDGSFTASNGEAYDWLELYNPTDDTIDLSGWHLTDSEEDLANTSAALALKNLTCTGVSLRLYSNTSVEEPKLSFFQ